MHLILSTLSQLVEHTVAQFVQSARQVGCRFDYRRCD